MNVKVAVLYYSKTGNTKKMAEHVARGVEKAGGEVVLRSFEDATVDLLPECDGIILGAPTYFGLPASPLQAFVDASIKYMRKLENKVGGAFTSSIRRAGGNETTIMAILQMMLVHGMIVQGTTEMDHYGAVAIGEPDALAVEQCEHLGIRVTKLAQKLKASLAKEV
ncbi:MAG: NAD(P)H-dependent oxidoreductase [Candidatus Bipolaricaulota bacterium]|nr:NAD(P)H-dependent oxidoreductase [Candidatus Bipolaricaulota bacterium]